MRSLWNIAPGPSDPRRAFTLIELLVVIAMLALLMTILLPAVGQARAQMIRVETRGQISALTKAVHAYSLAFAGQPPGVVLDPPASTGSPANISGAQNLLLGLLGCTRSGASGGLGGSYTALITGPHDNIDDDSSYQHPRFYEYRGGERKAHSEVNPRDPAVDTGYDGNMPVLVDYAYGAGARPILYFQRQATETHIPSILFPFRYGANAVYCQTFEVQAQTYSGPYAYDAYYTVLRDDLSGFIGGAGAADRFAIVSAGPDRQYFTGDDICSCR